MFFMVREFDIMNKPCVMSDIKYLRCLEFVGITPYVAPDMENYTIYFCFFSARNYYEYGKKYVVLELCPTVFNGLCFKYGEFYYIAYTGDYQLYFGRKAIVDIFSNPSKSDYHFNSIYSFKHIPELKKLMRKR